MSTFKPQNASQHLNCAQNNFKKNTMAISLSPTWTNFPFSSYNLRLNANQMRSIVIFRFFSHLSLLFVYQCITFLPLIFRFSFYINTSDFHAWAWKKRETNYSNTTKQSLKLIATFSNWLTSAMPILPAYGTSLSPSIVTTISRNSKLLPPKESAPKNSDNPTLFHLENVFYIWLWQI